MHLLSKIIYFVNESVAKKNDSSLDKPNENATTGPIYDFLDAFGPALIALLSAVAVIYCVVLGVQYAKAEKGEERDAAKKKAVNAAISFFVIIILVVMLYALRGTFDKILSE